MIITDRSQIPNNCILVATSIGGSPIHEGHTRLIRDCKSKAYGHFLFDRDPHQFYIESMVKDAIKLLVIVNSDDFLIRKHGFSFQNENSRAEILDSIKDVDFVVIHHQNNQFIDEAILHFKPDYLCKGGDRSGPQNMPCEELAAVDEVGCKLIYSVGSDEKASSSSDLMKRCANFYFYDKPYKDWLENRSIHEYRCLKDTMKKFEEDTLSKERDYLIESLDRRIYPD